MLVKKYSSLRLDVQGLWNEGKSLPLPSLPPTPNQVKLKCSRLKTYCFFYPDSRQKYNIVYHMSVLASMRVYFVCTKHLSNTFYYIEVWLQQTILKHFSSSLSKRILTNNCERLNWEDDGVIYGVSDEQVAILELV